MTKKNDKNMIHLGQPIFEIWDEVVAVHKGVSDDLILVICLAIWAVVDHHRGLNLISETSSGTSDEGRNLLANNQSTKHTKKKALIWNKSSSSLSGISFLGQKYLSIHPILVNSRSQCQSVPSQEHD